MLYLWFLSCHNVVTGNSSTSDFMGLKIFCYIMWYTHLYTILPYGILFTYTFSIFRRSRMPLAQSRLEILQVRKLINCVRMKETAAIKKLVENGIHGLINYQGS